MKPVYHAIVKITLIFHPAETRFFFGFADVFAVRDPKIKAADPLSAALNLDYRFISRHFPQALQAPQSAQLPPQADLPAFLSRTMPRISRAVTEAITAMRTISIQLAISQANMGSHPFTEAAPRGLNVPPRAAIGCFYH